MNVNDTLDERGKRYGKFIDVARVTINIQEAVFGSMSQQQIENLPEIHHVAIQMICHKLARICIGDINYADNWHDIAGYAQLVADHLNGIDR